MVGKANGELRGRYRQTLSLLFNKITSTKYNVHLLLALVSFLKKSDKLDYVGWEIIFPFVGGDVPFLHISVVKHVLR